MKNLVPVTLGNIADGSLMTSGLYWLALKKKSAARSGITARGIRTLPKERKYPEFDGYGKPHSGLPL
jgi:hypothetical protein